MILIIERKRVKDLSGSCCDGRLQNCFNLELLAKKKQVSFKDSKDSKDSSFQPMIVLIVEGRFQRATKRCFSKETLESYLDTYRYKIPSLKILYTKDTQSTADRIVDLAKAIPLSIKNQIKERKQEEKKNNDDDSIPRDHLYGNQMKVQFKLLRKLPKISIFLAHVLLDSNITAFDLLVRPISTLKRVQLSEICYPRSQLKIGIFKWQTILKEIEQNKVNLLKKVLLSIPYMKRYQTKNDFILLVISSILENPFEQTFQLWMENLEKRNIKHHNVSTTVLQRIWNVFSFHPCV